MREPRPPRLAVALLQRFSADQALIGDLLEEFEVRRSRAWFWRQAIASTAMAFTGRAQMARPHRWKAINLAVTPRGTPVGGVGLLALVVLISVVSPHAWWLLGIGVAGGIALGVVMVFIGRRRDLGRPHGRRNILLPIVLLIAAAWQ